MIDHDRIFKEILTTFFVDFMQLFFPQVLDYLDVGTLEFLDKELFTDLTSGERFEADVVVKAVYKQHPAFFIVLLEHQARSEEEFALRIFRYFALLHFKYGVPVYPIVLFSHGSPKKQEPSSYRVVFPDFDVLHFNYRVIQLRHLNWRDFTTIANPIASAFMARMRMKRGERPAVALACLRSLTKLHLDAARQKLLTGFINTYLPLDAEEKAELRQELAEILPEEQEKSMEFVNTWMKDGMHIEAAHLVVRLLTRRYGLVAPETEATIRALNLRQVEQLAEDLLDFTSRDDVTAWLAANPPVPPEAEYEDDYEYEDEEDEEDDAAG